MFIRDSVGRFCFLHKEPNMIDVKNKPVLPVNPVKPVYPVEPVYPV